MSRIRDLRKARAEDAEVRTWDCSTCERMVEETEPGPYCSYCRMYWEDVRKGVFDDQ